MDQVVVVVLGAYSLPWELPMKRRFGWAKCGCGATTQVIATDHIFTTLPFRSLVSQIIIQPEYWIQDGGRH